jgi:hypothetical protein
VTPVPPISCGHLRSGLIDLRGKSIFFYSKKKRKLNFSAAGMIRLPIVTVHRYDVSDFPPSAGTFRAFFERSILVLPKRSHFHVSVNNISNFFILSIQRIAIGGGDTT